MVGERLEYLMRAGTSCAVFLVVGVPLREEGL